MSLFVFITFLAVLLGVFIFLLRRYPGLVQECIVKFMKNETSQKYFADWHSEMAKRQKAKRYMYKEKLFQSLKENNSGRDLKILEIGTGSGTNLEFYPRGTHLTVLEVNPYMKDIFIQNLAEYPHIHLDNYLVGGVEEIESLVLESSFDIVLTTLVCCSVHDEQSVYDAAKFALKKCGSFYYMEHILNPHSSWVQYAQLFWDLTGIWPLLFGGCHLTRRVDKNIYRQGFSSVDQFTFDTVVNPGDYWAVKYVKHHVAGVATK